MKPGELRRFYDDAFSRDEIRLNGKVFLVLPWQVGHKITILVDGGLESFWSQNVHKDTSELIGETG
jgi:hypothetical protein